MRSGLLSKQIAYAIRLSNAGFATRNRAPFLVVRGGTAGALRRPMNKVKKTWTRWALAALCPAMLACGGLDSELSSEEQGLSDFSTQLRAMNPTGYWRLSDGRGATVMHDSSTNAVNGSYTSSVISGLVGSIGGDSNQAVAFTGANGSDPDSASDSGSHAQVPDRDFYSLTRGWDNFSRSTGYSGSWGQTADSKYWTPTMSPGNWYYVDGNHGVIDPAGQSGTYEQKIATISLAKGDVQAKASWTQHAVSGELQAMALVVQYADANNYTYAELVENADHTLQIDLARTLGGVTTYINTALVGTYSLNDWWYLRVQYDLGTLKARAWPAGIDEPTSWQVAATTKFGTPGGVAIRTGNSNAGAHPVVAFDDFRVQTLGFSIHLRIKVDTDEQDACTVYALSKGDQSQGTFHDGNREYDVKYLPATNIPNTKCFTTCPIDPSTGLPATSCIAVHPSQLRSYIFNREGGLGAGVATPITLGQWTSIVVVFDPGDYLDHTAHVTMYVNGVDAGHHETYWSTGPSPPARGSWAIYPVGSDSMLHLGTEEGDNSFKGLLDEVALFDRSLTATEAQSLFNWTL